MSPLVERALAIYVHIPFCPSKCGYCDFNSYAMQGEIMDRTVAATISQIERSPLRGRPAKTIFFGGGTPTFIPVKGLLSILETVLKCHPPINNQVEITSEANPGTVDAEKFQAMRNAGFNRISLGAQSFLDQDLVRLGRVHTSGEIERAVASARAARFENINIDLMFGLSDQSLVGWRRNLARALDLNVEHLSLYCLTIEPNTAFYRQVARKELILPDDDNTMQSNGYHQYEISNFAKSKFECRHNLEYWSGAEYAGYGPGAVASYEVIGQRMRTTNLKHPVRFCEAVECEEPVEYEVELLDEATLRTERLMLGMRLNQGLSLKGLDLDPNSIDRLLTLGWIEKIDEHEGDRIRLTETGRHLCSEVTLQLI